MSEVKLGELLNGSEEKDATHIAVLPVIAGMDLSPGDHVGIWDNDDTTVGSSDNPIGIIDPFLKTLVRAGQKVYVFMYPNSVTNLRHDWQHPEIIKPEPKYNPYNYDDYDYGSGRCAC